MRRDGRGAHLRADLSALRLRPAGNHADRRLSVLLRVQSVPRDAAPEAGRLLRVLLVRFGEVPTGPATARLLRLTATSDHLPTPRSQRCRSIEAQSAGNTPFPQARATPSHAARALASLCPHVRAVPAIARCLSAGVFGGWRRSKGPSRVGNPCELQGRTCCVPAGVRCSRRTLPSAIDSGEAHYGTPRRSGSISARIDQFRAVTPVSVRAPTADV